MYPNQNPNKSTSPKKPAALNPSAEKTRSSLKIGSPEIRVGLNATPKSSMMVVTGSKKNPTFTNEASMPKERKRLMKLPKRTPKI